MAVRDTTTRWGRFHTSGWTNEFLAEFANHSLKFNCVAGFVPDARNAQIFRGGNVFGSRFAGEDNDRQIFKFLFAAHPLQELQAGFVAEAQVRDENVRKWKARAVGIHSGADEIGAGFAGVAADEGGAGRISERAADEERVVGVILQHEKSRPKFLFHCDNRLARAVSWEMRKAPESAAWKR